MRAQYPILERYDRTWPVDDLMRQYLINHRANLRTKMAAMSTTPADAGGSTAEPSAMTSDPNRDSDAEEDRRPNGNTSDVTISDIEDNE